MIQKFEFKRDYVDLILIEIDRFEQPMTRTLLSFLQKRYGDEYWYRIDISGDERVDAYLISGSEKENDLDVIHIYSIAVRRTYEGHGWAKKLMVQLIKDAQATNKHQILLEVRENNPRAIMFYKRLGFVTTGRIADYYNNGIDAITMKFDL